MKYLRLSIPALVLLLGAGIFVAAQREPAHAQGQRAIVWEHKVLVVQPNNKEEFESKLQKAGAEGWECVSLAFPTSSLSQVGFCCSQTPKVTGRSPTVTRALPNASRPR
jgi:hypothetical protein